MDQFVLSENEVLYYEGRSRRKRNDEQAEIALRLVVPATMLQEVLQNCHDSLEGGHQDVVRTYQRVKYFWIGLYTDVEKHVGPCPDCISSKCRPHLPGHSPGNTLAKFPFELVSMDLVIPLPISQRGNTALLLFQCSFTGFFIVNTMSNADAPRVAQAFEECVYRRFGAPSLIRHDIDPRFMSEVFQAFAEMMQSKSRATRELSPTSKWAERALREAGNPIGASLLRSLTTTGLGRDRRATCVCYQQPMDTTRKETSFYLVHGWDTRSTLQAMTSSLRRGTAKQSEALAWKCEINRQQEIVLEIDKEYQATEKARRAKEHNESLSRQERATATQNDPKDSPAEPQ
ncbi:unnamed protein product [Phytophthora fragariaefolia]|uniref:Unnamed protein product n=1 Tax=Phytophthora fragariaefolia TaxID=1490495 RepID=A0A9W6X591_9STRA|nr:unnamed protein product [Phytophthora fragariaefolia]